jgi:hypothetical protein
VRGRLLEGGIVPWSWLLFMCYRCSIISAESFTTASTPLLLCDRSLLGSCFFVDEMDEAEMEIFEVQSRFLRLFKKPINIQNCDATLLTLVYSKRRTLLYTVLRFWESIKTFLIRWIFSWKLLFEFDIGNLPKLQSLR